jgi:hypothetical protein
MQFFKDPTNEKQEFPMAAIFYLTDQDEIEPGSNFIWTCSVRDSSLNFHQLERGIVHGVHIFRRGE